MQHVCFFSDCLSALAIAAQHVRHVFAVRVPL